MKASHCLLFGLLLLRGNVVHAEGGCPHGMLPASGTNINSCVPIPPGYYNNQQQAQPQSLPPSQWSRRWGAIATDEPKGILGEASGMASRDDAQRAAVADCRTKGGSPCKFEIAFDNECAALVGSDTGYVVTADTTTDKAIAVGMKTCTSAGYLNCDAYYTTCSMPVRIQ